MTTIDQSLKDTYIIIRQCMVIQEPITNNNWPTITPIDN